MLHGPTPSRQFGRMKRPPSFLIIGLRLLRLLMFLAPANESAWRQRRISSLHDADYTIVSGNDRRTYRGAPQAKGTKPSPAYVTDFLARRAGHGLLRSPPRSQRCAALWFHSRVGREHGLQFALLHIRAKMVVTPLGSELAFSASTAPSRVHSL
jgi:hypothetical protein